LFVEEAKTLVALSHGNIVPIYELGVVNERYFIAMEYIDGPSLDRLCRNVHRRGRTIVPGVAAYIASELLKGLDYAHRKGDGVIHRDLSPRNGMISREGEVKLVDFGLAVTVDGRQPAPGRGGRPVGSFPYMSPEQVRGEPLDGQSDLFSAGVLLWEMLTGQPLFARPDEDGTLDAVLNASIPKPSVLRPDLPGALDTICLRALARSKDERYRSAGAFLGEINKYVYALAEAVTPQILSELVAGTCPPSARERAASAAPIDETTAEDAIDRTRPMKETLSRDGSGEEKVKTFATNADFEEVLAKHNQTPLMPFRAISDAEALIAKQRRDAAAEASLPPPPVGSRMAWLIAAVAALVAIAAIAIAFRPSSNGSVADAAAVTAIAPDAPQRAIVATDAAVTRDAASTQISGDASPPADARVAKRRADAGAPRPTGTGTLRVGASPRGDVYVDGKLVGEAPGQWEIPAGPHRVRVKYKDQSRSFRVSVRAGEEITTDFIEFRDGP
jgi:hypothetical protein